MRGLIGRRSAEHSTPMHDDATPAQLEKRQGSPGARGGLQPTDGMEIRPCPPLNTEISPPRSQRAANSRPAGNALGLNCSGSLVQALPRRRLESWRVHSPRLAAHPLTLPSPRNRGETLTPSPGTLVEPWFPSSCLSRVPSIWSSRVESRTGAVPRRRPLGRFRRFQLRARLGLP